ncbi:MAG: hypothetical protein ACRDLS_02000 [Solirubrobacteraceae bacterium]
MLAGCGGGGGRDDDGERDRSKASTATTPRDGSTAAPPLCGRLAASVTGRVTSPAATELSGLVLSRSQAGILWSHNDSGNPPRLLALRRNGRLRADLAVSGAENVDWEDIALASAPRARGTLFIGDIGDNGKQRSEIVVYAIAEPRVGGGSVARGATAAAQRLVLRYPDGAHDAEALIVDRASGTLLIVTKAYDGNAGVYVTRRRSTRRTVTLRRAARLSLGLGAAITAGDLSADGGTLVLRSYDRAIVFARRGREPLARTLRRRPCVAGADLVDEGQGEALALTPSGRSFYTVPEGPRPAVRRYAPAR